MGDGERVCFGCWGEREKHQLHISRFVFSPREKSLSWQEIDIVISFAVAAVFIAKVAAAVVNANIAAAAVFFPLLLLLLLLKLLLLWFLQMLLLLYS